MTKAQNLELYRNLQKLDGTERDVVYMRMFADLSFKEIGEVLGKSENWARVTYFRSRENHRFKQGGQHSYCCVTGTDGNTACNSAADRHRSDIEYRIRGDDCVFLLFGSLLPQDEKVTIPKY